MAESSKYFSREELKCKCGCDEVNMDETFLELLDMLRYRYNKPMILSSAYRCPTHNKAIGGVPNSNHVQGTAVDVKIAGSDAALLITKLAESPINGLGVSQKGDWGSRFLHLDLRDTPTVWSY